LRTSAALPSTSQPTPQDFVSTYEELARYERIYSLQVSSKVSGTFQSAELAAAEIGGDRVRVVDTLSVSLAVAMLSHAIQRRLARGTTDEETDGPADRFRAEATAIFPGEPPPPRGRTDEEIHALVDRFRAEATVIVPVETLAFLQRGGRIGRAAALAGSLLNVRPILAIEDGVVTAAARVRGRQKALDEFARRFGDATEDRPGLRVAIGHADAAEGVGTLSELVWRVRPKAEIEFTAILGAVVGTHAGPGAVGFFWFHDE